MVSLVSPGRPEDQGAVDRDAEVVAVLGEALGNVHQHALLDVVQDLLVADSFSTRRRRSPLSRITFRVSRRTLALALHNQVHSAQTAGASSTRQKTISRTPCPPASYSSTAHWNRVTAVTDWAVTHRDRYKRPGPSTAILSTSVRTSATSSVPRSSKTSTAKCTRAAQFTGRSPRRRKPSSPG